MAVEVGEYGGELDLKVRQGATAGRFTVTLRNSSTGAPVNITDWIFRGQIRKTPSSMLSEGATMSYEITDAANGILVFWFTDEETIKLVADPASPTAPASTYVWDMEAELPNGDVRPVFYGNVRVLREVTKAVP